MVLDTVEYIPIGSRSKCNFLGWCGYGLAKKNVKKISTFTIKHKSFGIHNKTGRQSHCYL